MRLDHIHIQNYRQYQNLDINFPKTENDIHIIIGKNGVGKTTFLNAINWCLYNQEPHAYSSSDISLPILNLNLDSSSNIREIIVELSVSSDEGNKFIFRRVEEYHNNHKRSNSLTVKITDLSGETKEYTGESAELHVESFVPAAIREFFFFDGEQLDQYFLNDRTRNIERRIFILSHIDLLEKMEKHLNDKYKYFKRAAGKLNNNIGEKQELLENEEQKRENEKQRIKILNEQITKAKNILDNLRESLIGIPDVESLENNRDKLLRYKQDLKENINNKKNEIKNLLITSATPIFMSEVIDYVLDEIQKKDENNELPPPIDEDIIKKSLKTDLCEVCGRNLDNSSRMFLKNELNNYELSSKESKTLMGMKSNLLSSQKTIEKFTSEINNKNKELRKFLKSLEDVNQDISDIEKEYAGYDSEYIRKKHEERKKFENLRDKNNQDLGTAKHNLKSINTKIENLNKEVKGAMEADEKTKVLEKKSRLCYDAIDIVVATKNSIMSNTKDDIEKFTNNTFFKLLWKKETYSSVVIDDSYNLELIHNITKSNALGSASAAERELLALSFTLGIHSVSGFDSPLLIDTPLARVSDEHRINFAKVFLEVSKNKQIILLFTPAEFSEDIRSLFEKENVSNYEIIMGDDETISKIKGGL